MLDPNRNRNQLPPPVTTGRGRIHTRARRLPRAPRRAASRWGLHGSIFHRRRPSKNFCNRRRLRRDIRSRTSNAGRRRRGVGGAGLTLSGSPFSKGERRFLLPGEGELVPAAQAAEPFVAPPLAKPASFTDPAGRERVFADQASADAASARIQSPQGMEDLKRSILNRKFDITSTGQIPEGTFTPQELEFAAPAIPPPNLPLRKGEETFLPPFRRGSWRGSG